MKTIIRIKGMDCTNCALSIEKNLIKKKGVSKASVSFASEKAYIEHDKSVSEEKLKQVIKDSGYDVMEEHEHASELGGYRAI